MHQEPWREPRIVRRFRKMLDQPCRELSSNLEDFRNSDKLLFDSTGLIRLAGLYGWLEGKYGSNDWYKLGVGLKQWVAALEALAADVSESADLAVLSDAGLPHTFKVRYLADPDIGKDVVGGIEPPNSATGHHVLGYDHVVTHYIGPLGLTPLTPHTACIPVPRFRLYTVRATKTLAFIWPADEKRSWELF